MVYIPLDFGKDVKDFKNKLVMNGNVSSDTDLYFREGPVNYAICTLNPVILGSIPGPCFGNLTSCSFLVSFWLSLDSWSPNSRLLKIGSFNMYLNQTDFHNGSASISWKLNETDYCVLGSIPVTFKSWTFYAFGLDHNKLSVTLNNETTIVTDHACSVANSQLTVADGSEILVGGTTCIDEIVIFADYVNETKTNGSAHSNQTQSNGSARHLRDVTHFLGIMENRSFYGTFSKGKCFSNILFLFELLVNKKTIKLTLTKIYLAFF